MVNTTIKIAKYWNYLKNGNVLTNATKSRESNIQGLKEWFTNNSGFKIMNPTKMVVAYLPIQGQNCVVVRSTCSVGRVAGRLPQLKLLAVTWCFTDDLIVLKFRVYICRLSTMLVPTTRGYCMYSVRCACTI